MKAWARSQSVSFGGTFKASDDDEASGERRIEDLLLLGQRLLHKLSREGGNELLPQWRVL